MTSGRFKFNVDFKERPAPEIFSLPFDCLPRSIPQMFPPVSRLDIQDLHLRSSTDLMRLIRAIPGYDMYLILRNITFLKPEQLQQAPFRRTPSQTAYDAVVYGCGDGSPSCQLSLAGAMLSSGLLA